MKKRYGLYAVIVFLVLLAIPITMNYVQQEHLLFLHKPLPDDHKFSFDHNFEEHDFNLADGARIHAILFHQEGSRGVVAYYHGQGVNIEMKGAAVSETFLSKGYDVMIMDYRGFGKSRGPLSEKNLLEDALVPYDYVKERYGQGRVVVYGSSLGTGVATYVAAKREPRMLILESPYYNMIDLAKFSKPYIPLAVIEWILKYPLRTDLYFHEVNSDTHIFHGTADKIIPYQSSLMLVDQIKGRLDVELTILDDTGHMGVVKHPVYHKKLEEILP